MDPEVHLGTVVRLDQDSRGQPVHVTLAWHDGVVAGGHMNSPDGPLVIGAPYELHIMNGPDLEIRIERSDLRRDDLDRPRIEWMFSVAH